MSSNNNIYVGGSFQNYRNPGCMTPISNDLRERIRQQLLKECNSPISSSSSSSSSPSFELDASFENLLKAKRSNRLMDRFNDSLELSRITETTTSNENSAVSATTNSDQQDQYLNVPAQNASSTKSETYSIDSMDRQDVISDDKPMIALSTIDSNLTVFMKNLEINPLPDLVISKFEPKSPLVTNLNDSYESTDSDVICLSDTISEQSFFTAKTNLINGSDQSESDITSNQTKDSYKTTKLSLSSIGKPKTRLFCDDDLEKSLELSTSKADYLSATTEDIISLSSSLSNTETDSKFDLCSSAELSFGKSDNNPIDVNVDNQSSSSSSYTNINIDSSEFVIPNIQLSSSSPPCQIEVEDNSDNEPNSERSLLDVINAASPKFNDSLERMDWVMEQVKKLMEMTDNTPKKPNKKSPTPSPVLSARKHTSALSPAVTPTDLLKQRTTTPTDVKHRIKTPKTPNTVILKEKNIYKKSPGNDGFKKPDYLITPGVMKKPPLPRSISKIPKLTPGFSSTKGFTKPSPIGTTSKFNHIVSPVATYIKHSGDVPLIHTIKPSGRESSFFDSTMVRQLSDDSRLDFSMSESIDADQYVPTTLPPRAFVSTNRFCLRDERTQVIPGGEKIHKLLKATPTVIKHEGRINVGSNIECNSIDDSIADLPLMPGDMSIQVINNAMR